jgi:hypothetical protein
LKRPKRNTADALNIGRPTARLQGKRATERMRTEYSAWKLPAILDSRSEDAIGHRITNEMPSPRQGTRPSRIILDHEPINMNEKPKAARLISTTASVPDYFDVPNSLSFLR